MYDKNWLAGLLDGRGCFVRKPYYSHGKKYLQFYIKFSGNKEFISSICKVFGTKQKKITNSIGRYQTWILGSKDVLKVTNDIVNLMQIRQKECKEFLKAFIVYKNQYRWKGWKT